METELPITKVYVDSRLRASGTSSNFTFELAESITLPKGSVCYVDNIQVPHSWYTARVGRNKLFLRETQVNGTVTVLVLNVPLGNYNANSLLTALVMLLNSNTTLGGVYTGSYLPSTNRYRILNSAPNGTYEMLTDSQVGALAAAESMNAAIGNDTVNLQTAGGVAFVSGYTNTLSIHSVYLHSTSLGNFKVMGPRGERTCIRKIPVNSSFGGVTFDNLFHSQDFIECEGVTLRTLQFEVKDAFGREIDLNGAHVSFSLLFSAV